MNVQRRWIYVCAGLLLLNALVMGVLATASSWSAPAVVPEYYERAVTWDQAVARAAAAERLGWTVELALTRDGARLRMRDGDGRPVAGARIALRGFHRGHPSHRAELVVTTDAAGDAAGVPRDGAGPWRATAGWYELELQIDRGALGYTVHRAARLPPESAATAATTATAASTTASTAAISAAASAR